MRASLIMIRALLLISPDKPLVRLVIPCDATVPASKPVIPVRSRPLTRPLVNSACATETKIELENKILVPTLLIQGKEGKTHAPMV